jgi:Concanavalin A-like lectin/glucanases superfamily
VDSGIAAVLATHGAGTQAMTAPAAALCTVPNNFTVEFWHLSGPLAASSAICGCSNASVSMGWEISTTTTGFPRMRYRDSTATRTGPVGGYSPYDRTWHHYAFVHAGTTSTTYIDGGLYATGTVAGTASVVASTESFGIGAIPGSTITAAGGLFAEFRVWHEARTESDINLMRDAHATGFETNLAALWHLDSTLGSTELDQVGALPLQLGQAAWVLPAFPPPRPVYTSGGEGGGAGIGEIRDELARWLSQSALEEPDSFPKLNHDVLFAVRSKLGFLEGALDVQVFDLQAWLEFSLGNLELGVQRIDTNTKPPEGMPPIPNNTVLSELQIDIAAHDASVAGTHQYQLEQLWDHDSRGTDSINRATRIITGHPEVDVTAIDLPPWSVVSDVNGHTDEALVQLQGDLNDHEDSTVTRINNNTNLRVSGAVNSIDTQHTLQTSDLNQIIQNNADSVKEHMDVVQGNMFTRLELVRVDINQHTTDVGASINANTDHEVDVATGQILGRVGMVAGEINPHTTSEANRIIAALPSGGGSGDGAQTAAINAHTTAEADRVIGNNNAQTLILIAVQTALAAVTLTVNTILEKVQDMVDQLTNVAGMVSQILAWIGTQGGGTLSPVQVATTTFTDTTYWPQPADYYELEIDDPGYRPAPMTIPNGTYYRFQGWTAQRVAGKYVFGEPIAFNEQRVNAGGIVPDGLLVYVKQGCTGRITAFRYQ